MKYYRRKKYYHTRIRYKKPLFKRKLFWEIIIVSVLLILFFSFLLFSSFFQIKSINIKNSSSHNPKLNEMISSIINKDIEEKQGWFKPKNILFFRSDQIVKTILKNLPSIESIDISKKLPHSLNVTYREREAVAIWHAVDDNSQYFLIDKNAVLFQKTSSTTNGVLIETNDKFEKLGEQILDKNYLATILNAKERIEKITKDKVQVLVVKSPVYLLVKMGDGWSIYINPQKNLDWQLTELQIILDKTIPPKKINKLKYIDLRFNKVFISPSFE